MTKKTILAAVLFFVIFLIPVYAEVTGALSVGAAGRDFWRGQVLNDNLSLSPDVSISLNGFNTEWTGSYYTPDNQMTYSEYWFWTDAAMPYLEILTTSIGFVVYTQPYSSPLNETQSQEIFFGLSADVISQPYLAFYFDPSYGQNGGYLELTVSHTQPIIGENVSLVAGLITGYNFGQRWREDFEPSFTTIQGNLGVSYTIAGVTATAGGRGQIALNSQYLNVATVYGEIKYEISNAKEESEDKPEDTKEAK